jgi:hypothetical protein
MYQAKVNISLFRQTNLSTILKRLKKKFKRLKENIMSKRKDNKLQNRMKRFCNKFDLIKII